jgi:hypothetical protein
MRYFILVLWLSFIWLVGCTNHTTRSLNESFPGDPGVFVDTNNVPIEVPPSKLSE